MNYSICCDSFLLCAPPCYNYVKTYSFIGTFISGQIKQHLMSTLSWGMLCLSHITYLGCNKDTLLLLFILPPIKMCRFLDSIYLWTDDAYAKIEEYYSHSRLQLLFKIWRKYTLGHWDRWVPQITHLIHITFQIKAGTYL